MIQSVEERLGWGGGRTDNQSELRVAVNEREESVVTAVVLYHSHGVDLHVVEHVFWDDRLFYRAALDFGLHLEAVMAGVAKCLYVPLLPFPIESFDVWVTQHRVAFAVSDLIFMHRAEHGLEIPARKDAQPDLNVHNYLDYYRKLIKSLGKERRAKELEGRVEEKGEIPLPSTSSLRCVGSISFLSKRAFPSPSLAIRKLSTVSR